MEYKIHFESKLLRDKGVIKNDDGYETDIYEIICTLRWYKEEIDINVDTIECYCVDNDLKVNFDDFDSKEQSIILDKLLEEVDRKGIPDEFFNPPPIHDYD